LNLWVEDGANARILLRLPWFFAYATHISRSLWVCYGQSGAGSPPLSRFAFAYRPLSKAFSCDHVFGTIKRWKSNLRKRYPQWHRQIPTVPRTSAVLCEDRAFARKLFAPPSWRRFWQRFYDQLIIVSSITLDCTSD